MAVPVHFPDGSIRDVPGQLRAIVGTGGPRRPPAFEQVPLNCDSGWRYERRGRLWIALPRLGHVLTMRAPVPDWWSAIIQMADSHAASSPDRSAA